MLMILPTAADLCSTYNPLLPFNSLCQKAAPCSLLRFRTVEDSSNFSLFDAGVFVLASSFSTLATASVIVAFIMALSFRCS